MGDGWEKQIDILRKHGFCVDYIDHFDYEYYIKLIPTFDYYLYMGEDEGQMGFIDAVAAGVPTIVTEQGYHLDAVDGIAYGFNTFQQLCDQFNRISNEKRKYIDSVQYWNWKDYTQKHLHIWQYLLNKNNNKIETKITNWDYLDGPSSIYCYDDQQIKINK